MILPGNGFQTLKMATGSTMKSDGGINLAMALIPQVAGFRFMVNGIISTRPVI